MKKLLTALTMLLALASTARAEDRQPAWLCNLSFDAEAAGLQVIIGYFEMKGQGTLSCVRPDGETRTIPVKVDFDTPPIFLKVAVGVMKVHGEALQISLLAKHPEDLLGTYVVGGPKVSLGAGIGFFAGTHANIPSLSINVGLELVAGLGLSIGIDTMTLSALE